MLFLKVFLYVYSYCFFNLFFQVPATMKENVILNTDSIFLGQDLDSIDHINLHVEKYKAFAKKMYPIIINYQARGIEIKNKLFSGENVYFNVNSQKKIASIIVPFNDFDSTEAYLKKLIGKSAKSALIQVFGMGDLGNTNASDSWEMDDFTIMISSYNRLMIIFNEKKSFFVYPLSHHE